MRIGLLITSIGNFGQKGFYNAQEIGLAKELDKLVDELVIYKAVPKTTGEAVIDVDTCKRTTLKQIPVDANGINGKWDCSVMDSTLDALVYFSDTQLAVPSVYKWCQNNHVRMYPYIGVVESHSTSKIKKFLIDMLFQRNIAVYKNCRCFVKTPSVQKTLKDKGVMNTEVAPVGLDISLLHQEYEETRVDDLKRKYGYSVSEKVVLFIGRMTEEKQPLRMIEIFQEVYKRDSSYRLMMVGKGELLNAVKAKASSLPVLFIDQIPNKDIWELYRISEAFVNLNQQEIFGMAILEAMYYGCKVVAWKAPGPSFIIQDGVSGWLVESSEDAVVRIMDERNVSESSKAAIKKRFLWCNTAKLINDTVRNKM